MANKLTPDMIRGILGASPTTKSNSPSLNQIGQITIHEVEEEDDDDDDDEDYDDDGRFDNEGKSVDRFVSNDELE